MQLKITRSQRTKGLMTAKAIFMIDARAQFTQAELNCIDRYRLGGEILYDSEKSMARKDAIRAGQAGLMSAIWGEMTDLTVTVNSIQHGQHIECKTLHELMAAENSIKSACENLNTYLEVAATFDGRETLYTFEGGEAAVVARASSPKPQAIVEQPLVEATETPPVEAPPELEYDQAYEADTRTSFDLLRALRNPDNWPIAVSMVVAVAFLFGVVSLMVSHINASSANAAVTTERGAKDVNAGSLGGSAGSGSLGGSAGRNAGGASITPPLPNAELQNTKWYDSDGIEIPVTVINGKPLVPCPKYEEYDNGTMHCYR